ncbi:hypothetical protein M427DRAFT_169622 [Gonapodya prolifera JEL478]|uniref:Uncharacterized protein n=1 Tax=Gonapodya prolifera (strain JEL478) TaxID=1344416 RepID=A0A139B012_GONPJ|nr:hypothetical protein M427DRAFT_169622 [Gonapodya prolifera JEL478]|eukprot:KXS22319.1 hypothetical protein M427DRAFT_169622 [Gonapodya prolifera JEL478]
MSTALPAFVGVLLHNLTEFLITSISTLFHTKLHHQVLMLHPTPRPSTVNSVIGAGQTRTPSPPVLNSGIAPNPSLVDINSTSFSLSNNKYAQSAPAERRPSEPRTVEVEGRMYMVDPMQPTPTRDATFAIYDRLGEWNAGI